MVPAPGLFSTTTGLPICTESCCATMREMMSVPPPGGCGTMMVMARAGKSCANAAGAAKAAAHMMTSVAIGRRSIEPPSLVRGDRLRGLSIFVAATLQLAFWRVHRPRLRRGDCIAVCTHRHRPGHDVDARDRVRCRAQSAGGFTV